MNEISARMLGIVAPTSTMNGACFTPRLATSLFVFCSCVDSAFCTIDAKSRDSSILLLSAIARTMSGRLRIVRDAAGVLARGDGFRLRIRREVQEVGLDAARRGAGAGVGVDREEQVGACAVGDRGPLLERNEGVGATRHDHFDAGVLGSSFSRRSATSRTRSASVSPRALAPGSCPP